MYKKILLISLTLFYSQIQAFDTTYVKIIATLLAFKCLEQCIPIFQQNPVVSPSGPIESLQFHDLAPGTIPAELEKMAQTIIHGASIPKTLLIAGPAGTGKTSLARALAGETGALFLRAQGGDFVQGWMGAGAQRIKEFFQKARNMQSSPVILLIDDLDVIGRKNSSYPELENSLKELQFQLDSLAPSTYVIATCSEPQHLDEGLKRRFNRIIELGKPQATQRRALLNHFLTDVSIEENVLIDIIEKTKGWNPAELKNFSEYIKQKDAPQTADFYQVLDHLLQQKYLPQKGIQSERPSTFSDLAGPLPQEAHDIVSFIKDPHAYKTMGAHMPKGMLLIGLPGTGKTSLARAIAGEAGAAFFPVTASSFIDHFVGSGPKYVRELFTNARQAAGRGAAVIFIDEIDAIGNRQQFTGSQEYQNTTNELLHQMDGIEADGTIVVIAATNNPHLLDPALKRPGRFDQTVTIELPTIQARKEILAHYLQHIKTNSIDIDELAQMTQSWSPADLKNLVNQAAIIAVREKSSVTTQEHALKALKNK